MELVFGVSNPSTRAEGRRSSARQAPTEGRDTWPDRRDP